MPAAYLAPLVTIYTPITYPRHVQVDRDAFMDTFGPYFASQLKQAVEFLTKEVNM